MTDLIREFLDKCNNSDISIHCVGDAMVDEYYEVEIDKISPEYPVPIMLCQNSIISRPGGAANVAFQFKNLNANVNLYTLNDKFAFETFKNQNFKHITLGPNAKLPVKRRFTEHGNQVCSRLDIEFENCNLNPESLNLIYEEMKFNLKNDKNPDVVIFSDYNKGFFNCNKNFVNLYQSAISVVDPKSFNLDKWKNCTVFKPNAKEAFNLSGLSDWKEQCDFFTKKINCKSVIITDSGRGIKGFDGNEYFQFCPDISRISVESVIGAGDCFAAFLSMALALGFSIQDSAKIAHSAGLVYVQQKNNRPIVLAELKNDKIVKPFDIIKRDFTIALTNGCFDILHIGHLETLKFAKSKADKLVVAVNSDESIRRLKGVKRPIVPFSHRLAVLSSMYMVDFIIPFEEDTPIDIVKKIKPEFLIKGGDYTSNNIVGKEFAKEICIAPFIENYSSSNFIK